MRRPPPLLQLQSQSWGYRSSSHPQTWHVCFCIYVMDSLRGSGSSTEGTAMYAKASSHSSRRGAEWSLWTLQLCACAWRCQPTVEHAVRLPRLQRLC